MGGVQSSFEATTRRAGLAGEEEPFSCFLIAAVCCSSGVGNRAKCITFTNSNLIFQCVVGFYCVTLKPYHFICSLSCSHLHFLHACMYILSNIGTKYALATNCSRHMVYYARSCVWSRSGKKDTYPAFY